VTHDGDGDGASHSLAAGIARVTRVGALVRQAIDGTQRQRAVRVHVLAVIHWKHRAACIKSPSSLLQLYVVTTFALHLPYHRMPETVFAQDTD